MTNDTVYDSIFAGHFTNEAPDGFGIISLLNDGEVCQK